MALWYVDRSRSRYSNPEETWCLFRSGAYEISSQGRVRNVKTQRVLRPFVHSHCDRMSIKLGLEGHRHFFIHRLVAEAFLGPCPDGAETNHIDGNRRNNHVNNLQYVTRAENAAHSKRLGLVAHGERHGQARLTAEDVREIRSFGQNLPLKILAKEYGVSISTISKIRRQEAWLSV